MSFSFKKTLLFTGLSFSLVLAGCASGEEESKDKEDKNKQEETTTGDKSKEDTKKDQEQFDVESSEVAMQVKAYKDMKSELSKMKEDKEVDWDMVSSTYKEELQSMVTEVSGEYDQAITAAIEAGKSGDLEMNAARQIIDKTTQSYFYKVQKGMHGEIATLLEEEKKEEATQKFEQLKYLANEVFIPTATKRDEYYELTGDSSMEQNINAGLSAQEEALKEGNVDNFSVFKQLTDKSIYRSYYLAAQSYAEKIAKAVEEDAKKEELTIMQAEAWGFYQAIKGSLSSGDEQAAEKLNTLFSLDKTEPNTIKVEEVKDLFVQSFVGKILGYHEESIKELKEGNVTTARIEALEANVFTKAIELQMIDQLGQEETTSTLEKADKWFKAISNENVEEAEKLGQELVKTINQLVQK